jgi:hypothetical protein
VLIKIDECMLVRRKYNLGHLVREQWVFGGREVDTLDCFVVPVENRARENLLPLILANIRQCSIITSDVWALMGIYLTSVTLI